MAVNGEPTPGADSEQGFKEAAELKAGFGEGPAETESISPSEDTVGEQTDPRNADLDDIRARVEQAAGNSAPAKDQPAPGEPAVPTAVAEGRFSFEGLRHLKPANPGVIPGDEPLSRPGSEEADSRRSREDTRSWKAEEKGLNVVAKAVVAGVKAARWLERKNRESAVRKRLTKVTRDIDRWPKEQLRRDDEATAEYREAQHLYLEHPVEQRSYDQEAHYAMWQQRRTPEDPAVAAAVAAAEQPIQDQIDAITATGLYGILFTPGGRPTPREYRGMPYERRRDDPRAAHVEETARNNLELRRLVKEKLAARQRVLAEYAERGQSQPPSVQ